LRLAILAIGRMKAGPERAFVERYGGRIAALAPSLALGPLELREFEESRARRDEARRAEEGKTLLAALAKGAAAFALDERGRSLSSAAFAHEIARLRDQGVPALAFLIGGPDGLDEGVRSAARSLIRPPWLRHGREGRSICLNRPPYSGHCFQRRRTTLRRASEPFLTLLTWEPDPCPHFCDQP
jgi:23S rRNA (pseudouridine1915-N3)-methyltransferase